MSENTKSNLAPWATMIPAQWKVNRLGMVADIFPSNVDKHTIEGEIAVRLCNYTDVYKNDRITSLIEFMTASALPREIEKFQVRKGDVLATKDSESPCDIAVSSLIAEDLPGVLCGYHLAMIRPDARKINGPFLAWVQASKNIRAQYEAFAVGVTRFALSQSALKDALVPVPPLPDQPRISAYLDEQTAKVDRLIALRRRQMELLKEQRAALIQQAVTRGLDPAAPMKDSGIPWLGEIPAHWPTTRLAHHTTRIGDGLHGTPEYVDESPYRFVNGNNLSGGAVTVSSTTGCVSEGEFQKHRVALGECTLLMSINGTIGNIAYYQGESIILGKSAAYINCAKFLSRRYLFYFLQSKSAGSFFQLEATGTTIFNLSLASIRNLPIVLPSLAEQKQIVDFIEIQSAKLDAIATAYARQLTLLAEYRSALIHECVTGQREVPESLT